MVNIKGVSEVVGYLLTFSVVVAIVAVVYSAGMPMIEQSKESTVYESMGTSFLALQSNMKKVAFGQSPLRTMKFNLIKGSISAKENAGSITVNGQTIQFGNIEYTLGSRKIVYENGAVIQSTLGGNIIISDPPIFYGDDNDVFISVINASGTFSAGGGIAEMQMRHENTTVIYSHNKSLSNVNITITSSYGDAWERYLRETFGSYPVNLPKCNLTLVTHNVSLS